MTKNELIVQLDKDCEYFGGDVFSGRVKIWVAKSGLQINDACFVIAGTELCSDGKPHRFMEVKLAEFQMFVKHHAVNPGEYEWPFSVRLPPLLPATYAGCSRYSCEANINIQRRVKNKRLHCRVTFDVRGNMFHHDRFISDCSPVTMYTSKKFSFASGELALAAIIPRTNYFVGDTIRFVVKISNRSPKKVKFVKTYLIMTAEDYTYPKTSDTDSKWSNQAHESCTVAPNSNASFEICCRIDPQIAPSIPSRGKSGDPVGIDKFYTITHKAVLEVVIPGSSSLQLKFPVNLMHVDPKCAAEIRARADQGNYTERLKALLEEIEDCPDDYVGNSKPTAASFVNARTLSPFVTQLVFSPRPEYRGAHTYMNDIE